MIIYDSKLQQLPKGKTKHSCFYATDNMKNNSISEKFSFLYKLFDHIVRIAIIKYGSKP